MFDTMIRCSILLCALTAEFGGTHAAISDADWESPGQSAIFHRHIWPYTMVGPLFVHAIDRNGNLYLCRSGRLNAGGVPISAIAKWDRQNWSDVGMGIDGNLIRALAFDSAGNLYAGGVFDTIAGVTVNNIIKWDGSAWSSVGSGVADGFGYVNALAIDGRGNIYAALISNDSFPNSIIKWDGAAWSTIGRISPSGGFWSLALDDKRNLYVYGGFDTINEVEAHNIAKWDGTSWSALGKGLRPSNEPCYSLDAFNMRCNGKELYVTGNFDSAGPVAAHDIAKWDGTAWSTVGNQLFSSVHNLESDSTGNIYISETTESDRTGVAKWDGTTWTFLNYDPDLGGGELLVDRSGNVYVASGGRTGLLQWNNGSWSPLCKGNGLDGAVNAFAFDSISGNLYVGGEFIIAGDKTVDAFALWNGNTWNPVEGNPLKGTQNNWGISALVFDKHGILYTTGARGTVSCMGKLDGSALGKAGDLVNVISTGKIYALATDSTGNLYVGGEFDTIGRVAARKIAKWDGTVWSPLGEGIMGNDVRAIVFDKRGNLYAAGDFDKAGSGVAHNIAKWDGLAWSPLGAGILKDPDIFCPVSALAIDHNGDLYAGGEFNFAGGLEAHGIVKWDGAAWSTLGEGLRLENSGSGYRRRVFALTIVSNGDLYAGGEFDHAGVVKARNIAKWDGAAWSALGSGIDASITDGYGHGCVSALAENKNGTLYVGGDFCIAGNKTAVGFAWCNINGTNAQSPRKALPFRQRLVFEEKSGCIRLNLYTGTDVQTRVFSLTGREMYRTVEFVAQGNHSLRIGGKGLAKGVYIAQVDVGAETLRCRFIVGK